MSLTVLLQGDPRAPHQVRLGAALASRGHRVVVANAPAIAERIRSEYGATCEEINLETWGPFAWRSIRYWWALRNIRPDIVHLNYILVLHKVWTMVPGAPPFVATAWGSDLNNDEFMQRPDYKAAMQRILSQAGAITADSYQLLDRAQNLAGPTVPSELVLWGVDLDTFSRDRVAEDTAKWRNDLGLEKGQKVLLSPRQTAAHYHIDDIVRGFAGSLWSKEGILLIKCHGRPNEEERIEALKKLGRSLGIEDRLRFAPACPYERLAGLYALADAAVSALKVDGFPSTFSELFALQVPVVATNLPGYKGLLEDNHNALLFQPGDEASLVGALDRFFSDASLADRLRRGGEEFATKRADFRVTVDRFEALYHQSIERQRVS